MGFFLREEDVFWWCLVCGFYYILLASLVIHSHKWSWQNMWRTRTSENQILNLLSWLSRLLNQFWCHNRITSTWPLVTFGLGRSSNHNNVSVASLLCSPLNSCLHKSLACRYFNLYFWNLQKSVAYSCFFQLNKQISPRKYFVALTFHPYDK